MTANGGEMRGIRGQNRDWSGDERCIAYRAGTRACQREKTEALDVMPDLL
jgi:hypothetical protein